MQKAIVALVIAIAAAAAWFGLTRGDAPPRQPNGPADATTTVDAHTTEGPGATSGHAAAASAPEPPNERIAAPAAFPGKGADVLVVEFGSKEPVAGAEVLCWPPDFDWQKLTAAQRQLFTDDRDAALRQLQPPGRTDAAGRCRIPLGKDQTQVIAHHGDHRAEGWLTADTPQPLVLALRPDRSLHVRVVLADGRPASGIQVMATREPDKAQFGIGITDGEGHTCYHHLQQLAGDQATVRLELRALFPGGACEPVVIDATDPPAEVLLRLPRCGSLVVRVLDADGQPVDPSLLEDARVRLTLWSDRPTDRYDESNVTGRGDAPIDPRGNATFPAVAFDQLLRAEMGHRTQSPMVPGPSVAEPRAELVLREDPTHAVFTGVLLDAEGQPYVGAYQFALHYQNGMSGNGGRTDANGRFRLGLGGHAVGQRATPSFDTLVHSRQTGATALAAELPAREVTKGTNDLGEVRLAPHAVLARGRFVGDDLPERLPVQLQFEVRRNETWDTEWNLQPVWSDHAFTVKSRIPPGTPMRLRVNTDVFLPVAPIEFRAGATDLVIPLQRGGSVSAWFLVDAGTPTDDLRFDLRVGGTPPPTGYAARDMRDRWRGSQAIDGKLGRSWSGLVPGSYLLEVHAPGSPQPLVAIDAIEVTDGPCEDGRLQAIDLRGRLRAVTVRATAADGSAIASREAVVIVRDGSSWTGHHLGSGAVTFAATGPVDLLVVAPRHEMAILDGVFASRTVALAAAAPATLVIEWPEALPAGITARLSATPDVTVQKQAYLSLDTGRGMPATTWFEENPEVAGDGRATLSGRFRGEHRLQLHLRSEREGAGLELVPQKVTLPARGDIPVRIDGASWRRAMQRLHR